MRDYLLNAVGGLSSLACGGGVYVIENVVSGGCMKAGIVYYSDNRPDPRILHAAQRQLVRAAAGRPIVSVTLKPTDFGQNIVLPLQRGYPAMFRQILAGLEALQTDVAFLVEHDVLYTKHHFTFEPPRSDCYYYNLNAWKVDASTGRAVTYITKQTSQLCANRELLVSHYRKRIERVEREGFTRRMGFEPGSHGRPERVDDVPSATWQAPSDLVAPNLDIRHDANLTETRWSKEKFRDQRSCQGWCEADVAPGWGYQPGRFMEFLETL